MPYPRHLDGPNGEAYAQELAFKASERRRYEAQLLRHPDPRDPDYPGEWIDEDEAE